MNLVDKYASHTNHNKKNGTALHFIKYICLEVRSYFPKTHLDNLVKGVVYMDDIYAKANPAMNPVKPTRLDAIHR